LLRAVLLDDELSLAAALGFIQAAVGHAVHALIDEDLAAVDHAAGADAHGAVRHRRDLDLPGRLYQLLKLAGDIGILGQAQRIDDEFIAAQAHDDVAAAEDPVQGVRQRLQNLVAGGVPVGVVDGLEVVDVHDDEGSRDSGVQQGADAGVAGAAVVDVGQQVMLGHVLKAGFGFRGIDLIGKRVEIDAEADRSVGEDIDQIAAEDVRRLAQGGNGAGHAGADQKEQHDAPGLVHDEQRRHAQEDQKQDGGIGRIQHGADQDAGNHQRDLNQIEQQGAVPGTADKEDDQQVQYQEIEEKAQKLNNHPGAGADQQADQQIRQAEHHSDQRKRQETFIVPEIDFFLVLVKPLRRQTVDKTMQQIERKIAPSHR